MGTKFCLVAMPMLFLKYHRIKCGKGFIFGGMSGGLGQQIGLVMWDISENSVHILSGMVLHTLFIVTGSWLGKTLLVAHLRPSSASLVLSISVS